MPRHRAVGLLLSLVLCGLAVQCSGPAPDPETRLAPSQLRADLSQLKERILKRHPLTFADSGELIEVFEHQATLLTDSLTTLEFYGIAAPAVAVARCWHTRLSLPESIRKYVEDTDNYLPLEIKIIRDRLFVHRIGDGVSGLAPGCVIRSINSEPAATVLQRIRDCLPTDGGNVAAKDWVLNNDFAWYYSLCIGSTATFAIGYMNTDSGDSATAVMAAVARDEYKRIAESSESQTEEDLIVSEIHEDMGYAVLRINFFGYFDDFALFTDPVDSFFSDLSHKSIGALVLDLRGNDGGDAYSAAYLLGYLLSEPFRYFSPHSTHLLSDLQDLQPVHENRFAGNLYVLVDGGCCSTSAHLLALLRSHGIGTFIGTKTGGSYACNGGFREVTLKHTRLQLLLPHAVFIADADDLPCGYQIAPDHIGEPNIDDLVQGNDPAMAVAESLITRQ